MAPFEFHDLAQELIETILDFLHDDRQALINSSLVCRSWVPATRHHLFYRVTLNRFHYRPGLRLRDTAEPFLEICRSSLCTILPAIQDVLLNINTMHSPTARLVEAILGVLSQAPVRRVVYVDHTPGFAPPMRLAWMARHLPALEDFSYNGLDQFAADALAFGLLYDPHLRSLGLFSGSREPAKAAISQSKPYPTMPPGAFAQLTALRLRLYAPEMEELMAWLVRAGDLPSLETFQLAVFHCRHNGWGPVTSLNAFLADNGPHLKDVGFVVKHEDSDGDVEEEALFQPSDGDIDLGACTNLDTLLIQTHDFAAINSVLTSLPESPTRALETLVVDFSLWIYWDEFPCHCDEAAEENITAFISVVSQEQFAQLHSLQVRVPEFFGERGRQALREYFPRLKDSDVLRIDSNEEFMMEGSWESVNHMMFGELTAGCFA